MKTHTSRNDDRFSNELEDIQNQRLDKGIDKKRISVRKITSLIPRHKRWQRMKEEIIEYVFRREVNFMNEEE